MIKTIFDEKYEAGVAEGEAIGFEKGEVIGFEKGEVIGFEKGEAVGIEKERGKGCEKMTETLLRILTKRLGDVPHTVHDKLYAIHDLDVLGQLTDVALDCQSFDEFGATITQYLT